MFVVCAAIGLFNGFMIGKLALNAFMVTLAMLILLRGVTLGTSAGQTFSNLPLLRQGPGQRPSCSASPCRCGSSSCTFILAQYLMRHRPVRTAASTPWAATRPQPAPQA